MRSKKSSSQPAIGAAKELFRNCQGTGKELPGNACSRHPWITRKTLHDAEKWNEKQTIWNLSNRSILTVCIRRTRRLAVRSPLSWHCDLHLSHLFCTTSTLNSVPGSAPLVALILCGRAALGIKRRDGKSGKSLSTNGRFYAVHGVGPVGIRLRSVLPSLVRSALLCSALSLSLSLSLSAVLLAMV
jgi:hypothetical protein